MKKSNRKTIKLVALDIDGTILHHQPSGKSSISEGIKAILQELQRRNIKIMIATGRNYGATYAYLEELALTQMHHVLCSGAVIRSPEGHFMHVNYIPQNDYKEILTLLLEEAIPFAVIQEENVYSKQEASHINLQATSYYNVVTVEKLLTLSGVTNLWIGPHAVSALHKQLARFDLTILVHGDEHLEVLAKDLGKGVAIDKVAGLYGLTMENVMAIGDGGNDLQMLQMAGLGVAMGNAPDWVKSSADVITDTIEDDGVVTAIKKYIL